ncbi:MAG: bifunctional DNA-formamidopyrimidine glycosylase/DNA-(apurinic or apyrimidinic site) lyase [Desulfovibrionaceae bacterium]|nr:bifunctional DNA-formamidopyrimidine glycosylase/DNA-(apurinic or apyrimidinic site) lyase [Desulfovibrionaceae bacterium]
MPELPEVEVTRRSFADRICGARILAAHQGKPLRWPLGLAPGQLAGRTVLEVGRRGKYLLLRLDEGVLLLHLGMSGSLDFRPAQPPPGPHDHFDLHTTRGVLRLHDPRRFGAVVWSPSAEAGLARRLLAGLGVEPLDDAGFDPAAFHAALKVRRAPIKQVLLAGDVVVGVGNIYASEALFLAGIRPTVRASRLSRPRADRLRAAIREVLARAVERGGSTLRNFSSAAGERGHFQSEAAVYARAGQPCVRCGAPLRQIRQGQRSTFFCPRCQR